MHNKVGLPKYHYTTIRGYLFFFGVIWNIREVLPHYIQKLMCKLHTVVDQHKMRYRHLVCTLKLLKSDGMFSFFQNARAHKRTNNAQKHIALIHSIHAVHQVRFAAIERYGALFLHVYIIAIVVQGRKNLVQRCLKVIYCRGHKHLDMIPFCTHCVLITLQ